MVSIGTHSIVYRMIRASRLDVHLFEEVEADTSATRQALSVVAIVALASGIGGIAFLGTIGLRELFVGVVFAIAGWAIWAWILYLIGTKILPAHETRADWGQLARTVGFAQSPGVLRVLGVVPVVGGIIFWVVSIWMLVAMVIAVRQALDYTSTWRAIGVVLLGFIPYAGLLLIASAFLTPATVPGAPINVYATASNTQATVTWIAPASTGGAVTTGYEVTASPGGQTVTVDGWTLTATFTELTNGTSYTFSVVPTNSVGTGASSSASNAVTPATVPGAPTNVYATAGNTQATVTWDAPSSNGGSSIAGYTVTASPGGQTVTVGRSTLTATFTGLTNGTAYTFTVVATNSIGDGVASSPSSIMGG